MANRNFAKDHGMLEKGCITLVGQIPLDAAGAVGTLKFQGVTSVVKSSTATYTITLQDRYLDLMGYSVDIVGGATCHKVIVTAKSTNTATPTITIKTASSTNVETATTATGTIYCTFFLRNSKGNPGET